MSRWLLLLALFALAVSLAALMFALHPGCWHPQSATIGGVVKLFQC